MAAMGLPSGFTSGYQVQAEAEAEAEEARRAAEEEAHGARARGLGAIQPVRSLRGLQPDTTPYGRCAVGCVFRRGACRGTESASSNLSLPAHHREKSRHRASLSLESGRALRPSPAYLPRRVLSVS